MMVIYILILIDCLEKKFGRRPMMFTTNGFDTYFWDDQTSPQRRVSEVFNKDDLQRLMNRRMERKPLQEISINDKITDIKTDNPHDKLVMSGSKAEWREVLSSLGGGLALLRPFLYR